MLRAVQATMGIGVMCRERKADTSGHVMSAKIGRVVLVSRMVRWGAASFGKGGPRLIAS